jgi:23S rRNA pseudouridine1911/1915/1917 synthase
MRLDAFVVQAMRDLGGPSRVEVQRWIAAGGVTAEGRSRRSADKVRAGERVEVVPLGPVLTEVLPEEGVAFEVLHVDEAIVVVDKPAGLVVHPARGHTTGTLVHGLLGRGFFAAEDREGVLAGSTQAGAHLRPGIVHRLDRGTSGVLVVARTGKAREGLKEQFSSHTIERIYEALVLGSVTQARHDTLHGRHPKDRLRFTTHVREGKRAVTHVEVVERYGTLATHVRCRLETGRTHQIRVHLSESGTPVIGDTLYGRAPRDEGLAAIGAALGHQALHARVLGFVHPTTGKKMRFESPLPADFVIAMNALAMAAESLT